MFGGIEGTSAFQNILENYLNNLTNNPNTTDGLNNRTFLLF
jgi:hypothetical protein